MDINAKTFGKEGIKRFDLGLSLGADFNVSPHNFGLEVRVGYCFVASKSR